MFAEVDDIQAVAVEVPGLGRSPAILGMAFVYELPEVSAEDGSVAWVRGAQSRVQAAGLSGGRSGWGVLRAGSSGGGGDTAL